MCKTRKSVKLTIEFEEYELSNQEDLKEIEGCDNIMVMCKKHIFFDGRHYNLPVPYQFFVDKKTNIVKFVKEP